MYVIRFICKIKIYGLNLVNMVLKIWSYKIERWVDGDYMILNFLNFVILVELIGNIFF